jgi:DNA-directed RNA polymerase subunit F
MLGGNLSVRRFLIAGMVVMLLAAGAAAQQEVDTKAIEQLVAQLSDCNWRLREKAQKELILIGPPALPYLKKLENDPAFEVRFRAKKILSHIRVISPEDTATAEKYLKEYDPGADRDKIWNLVIKLRRLKNIRFYLIQKIVKAQPREREKIASLLACIEYRVEGRRIDKDISYSTDILLSFARDELLSTQLRLRSLKALSLIKDWVAAAVLADILQEQSGKLATLTLNSLKSIKGEKGKEESARKQRENTLTWWSSASKEPEYEKALKHLKIRKEFENKESSKEISFLGVVKDAAFPDKGGARIERPWPDSGAMKVGIKAGDTIIEFDGRPVSEWNDMVHGIRRGFPEQKVRLKILRGQKEIDIEVVLSKRPEDQ